jgi:hypothetical protein
MEPKEQVLKTIQEKVAPMSATEIATTWYC